MKLAKLDEDSFFSIETRTPNSLKLDRHISQVETRVSRGTVVDSQVSQSESKNTQPYDYKLFLEMIRFDPVLATAIDTTVDVGTRNGYYFTPKYGETVSNLKMRKVQDRFDNNLDFDSIQDNLWYQLVLHHISYLEYVRNKGAEVDELNILETSEMSMQYTKNGLITGYVQNQSTNNEVEFSTDEVTTFCWKKIGSQVYPYVNLEPIAKTYVSNLRAHDYLQNIFLNMPPKLMYVLKNASTEQRKAFISNLRVSKTNYATDLVAATKEGAEAKPLMMPEIFGSLLSVLEYLREQILMIMRVPPVWVGIINSDSANRGNAEAQIFSFETRIRKLQQRIESQMNREVLPRLGIHDLLFKYNNISLQDESNHIKNAAILKSMGIDDKSIIYFLKEKGVCLPSNAKIEQPEQHIQAAANEVSPSREGMDKKNEQMKTNINKKGTSDSGKEKSEEQNMKVRTQQNRWEFPFIVE